MTENFKDFLKNIPESVAVPLEESENADPLHEGQTILNELDVLKGHESAKEAQIGLLPKIKKLIEDLRELQAKRNKEAIQNALVRLVAERDRIEKMIN